MKVELLKDHARHGKAGEVVDLPPGIAHYLTRTKAAIYKDYDETIIDGIFMLRNGDFDPQFDHNIEGDLIAGTMTVTEDDLRDFSELEKDETDDERDRLNKFIGRREKKEINQQQEKQVHNGLPTATRKRGRPPKVH